MAGRARGGFATHFAKKGRFTRSTGQRLIEQATDGLLLLGAQGEALVEARDFLTVFQTLEEYRLVNGSQDLGAVPVNTMLTPGMYIIFSGRRWEVMAVHEAERIIEVKPAEAGVAPLFSGEIGDLHDRVIAEMMALWRDDRVPSYLDETAAALLSEGRRNYAALGFLETAILTRAPAIYWLASARGSVGNLTLALALQGKGFRIQRHDGFLEVDGRRAGIPLHDALEALAQRDRPSLAWSDANLRFEKFHPYLSSDLLIQDAASSRVDLGGLPATAEDLLRSNGRTMAIGCPRTAPH